MTSRYLPPGADEDDVDRPIRVAILTQSMPRRANITALKYLFLRANRLQRTFQFEFHELFSCPELDALASRTPVDASTLPNLLDKIRAKFISYQQDIADEYGLSSLEPERIIVVSMARLDNNFYIERRNVTGMSLLALGDWKKYLAPPTLIEFCYCNVIVTLLDSCLPELDCVGHAATRGCLGDFTPDIGSARYKILAPGFCDECEQVLIDLGLTTVRDDVLKVLDFTSMWQKDDPHCPAAIVRKLGIDLFRTKSLSPSLAEAFLGQVKTEIPKQIITLIFGTLITTLIVGSTCKKAEPRSLALPSGTYEIKVRTP